MKRVAVGMSGGIDSLFCALLLQQQGYEVIGVHLSLYGTNHEQDVEQVCRQAGIPLYVQDGKELFRKTVIEDSCGNTAKDAHPVPVVSVTVRSNGNCWSTPHKRSALPEWQQGTMYESRTSTAGCISGKASTRQKTNRIFYGASLRIYWKRP